MPGRITAWSPIPIPCPSRALESDSQGECTIDSGELEIDPCYHLEAWLGKPFPLTLAASDLTFCFSQQTLSRGSPGPCPRHPGLGTHLGPLEQFLLSCWLKSSFREGFFLVFLGKDKLCWFSLGGVPLSSVHVLFFLCLASCRWAFQELFLIGGRQWNLRGLLMHGRLQEPQLHSGSNSSSIPVTADTDDHIVQVFEGHKQIQKLRSQDPRLTLRSYHTTANWF